MRIHINRYKIVAVLFIALIICVDAYTVIHKIISKYNNYMNRERAMDAVQIQNYNLKEKPVGKSIDEKLKMLIGEFNVKINDSLAGRTYWVTLNGGVQQMLGKKAIEDVSPDDRVIKLNNGYLTFLYKWKDMKSPANHLIHFNQSLKELHIPLLYIQAPFKIDKYNTQLPEGLKDTTNQNADEFLSYIDGAVDYVDLREEIYKDGLSHYELFFKTDHHWKPEAAFWAYGKIRQILDEKYGFDIDAEYGNFSRYEVKKYENYFLGTQGKRAGLLYAGTDDISLIYPKFETKFIFKVPDRGIEKNGDFLHTMFDFKHVERRDYFGKDPYSVYAGADYPLNIITNQTTSSRKKIVLIKDSFFRPLSLFLAMDCEKIYIVDLRRYNNKFSLLAFIKAIKPDIVLVGYNPSLLEMHTEDVFHFE